MARTWQMKRVFPMLQRAILIRAQTAEQYCNAVPGCGSTRHRYPIPLAARSMARARSYEETDPVQPRRAGPLSRCAWLRSETSKAQAAAFR